jgi:tRNA(Ile)-lysidine synthase
MNNFPITPKSMEIMQKEFERYLKDACRCSPEKRYLLTVSGGIDSVVMAELFHEARIDFDFAHCNFNLRGEESEGDQIFVEDLARRMKVSCFVTRFDTPDYAEVNGISIQMAARDLRYAWFEEIRKKNGHDFIVTGHNQNDMVETVLINFARGSGIRGLSGMRPKTGFLVRPLLFASRAEIRKYADSRSLSWREDSSNAETKYIRNRIRHVLIPEFEAINPAFMQNATETISHLYQTGKLVNLALAQIKKAVWIELPEKVLIDIEKLREFPSVETTLFELLREFGCTSILVRSIMSSFESTPGKRFITRTHSITRDRAHLIITKNSTPDDTRVNIDEDTVLITHPIHLTAGILQVNPGFTIPPDIRYAVLDREKLVFPLILRRWKTGDQFHPLGMKGSKKISDFLIDNKVPLPDKQNVWVIESSGNIVWVVNHRIDDRYRITPDTSRVLILEYMYPVHEG